MAATQRTAVRTDGLGPEVDDTFIDFGSYFHTKPQLNPPKRKVPQPHRKINLSTHENEIYS